MSEYFSRIVQRSQGPAEAGTLRPDFRNRFFRQARSLPDRPPEENPAVPATKVTPPATVRESKMDRTAKEPESTPLTTQLQPPFVSEKEVIREIPTPRPLTSVRPPENIRRHEDAVLLPPQTNPTTPENRKETRTGSKKEEEKTMPLPEARDLFSSFKSSLVKTTIIENKTAHPERVSPEPVRLTATEEKRTILYPAKTERPARQFQAKTNEPRLVIGRLTVEVIQDQKAPAPARRHTIIRNTTGNRTNRTKVSSKLRFGLGQM